ncbi:SRPBCC domain-containing protein [Candidatus Shapirobacteria bacterium]|nr:SRPBCC domain-containing protein [Candidatus Shapirobacteria bacterium]
MGKITVEVSLKSNISNVWKNWTDPVGITNWNHASDDWCCPRATSDLRVGGKFNYRMESVNDKSVGFDFEGEYTRVEPENTLAYFMTDGRKVEIKFEKIDNMRTKLIETFDAETQNSEELQRNGWQAILENFKKYCETVK